MGEEQRSRSRGRVDAHRQAGHVHALGDHPHRHHPAVLARSEGLDATGRTGVIGQHHGGSLAGDGTKPLRISTGGALIRGDDESAGVGHLTAHFAQALVGCSQNRGDPLPRGIEGRPPGLSLQVLGQRLPQSRRHLITGLGAPAHITGVGHEHDRAHDPVPQGVGVVVGVVGSGALGATCLLDVAHERNGRLVGAEGRPGQGEPAASRRERLTDGIAPAQRVPTMVNLIKNHQSANRVSTAAVKPDVGGHLSVGHSRPIET